MASREIENWRLQLEADAMPASTVEGIRGKLLNKVHVPSALITKALRVSEDALSATEVKYFTHRGLVTDERHVKNHSARLAAADQIYNIAGVYIREKDKVSTVPTVAFEVNPTTGVVKFIIGANLQPNGGNHAALEELKTLSSLSEGDDGQLSLIDNPPIEKGSIRESESDVIETVKYTDLRQTQTEKVAKQQSKKDEIPDYILRMLGESK